MLTSAELWLFTETCVLKRECLSEPQTVSENLSPVLESWGGWELADSFLCNFPKQKIWQACLFYSTTEHHECPQEETV